MHLWRGQNSMEPERKKVRSMRAVCQVCMHHCNLEPGQIGFCRARKNEEGEIICANYGRITSLALDPIEKKPLRMFYPGKMILSAGSYGCNLRCMFCQNHGISMAGEDRAEFAYLSPADLADRAVAAKRAGNIGVAFTYNEPLVGWEYIRDTAKLVREAGMKNVLVTNGTSSLEVLDEILPFVDAMNIDLKGFREEYYQELGGSLQAVKEFIVRSSMESHVELTTLIVPGKNDSVADMEDEARWIADLGRQIPLHISRFFPRYQMSDAEATDVRRIYLLAETARKYLDNVFVGNC